MAKINIKSPRNLQKIIISIILILVFIIGLVFLSNKKNQKNKDEPFTQYTIQKDDKQMDASKEGLVRFSFGKNSFIQTWDKEKIAALYKYIKTKGKKTVIFLTKGDYVVVIIYEAGEKTVLYLPADDPTMEDIFDTLTGDGDEDGSGGEGGGDGGGGGIFDFNSPTPTAITNTPNPTGSGATIPEKPDDCPLWLLSWCVYPHPSPTPVYATPTSSITPDCSYWLRDVQDKAIISNTLCIKPSPSPQ